MRATTFGFRAPAFGLAALLLLLPSAARADATAFLSANLTPSNRAGWGFAAGITVLVLGFEFEYANTSEDLDSEAPSLRTGIGSLIVQTPFPIGGLQFYGTAGGGFYRERLDERQETHFAGAIGGGVKISLAGPLRLRLDYRLFTLRGSPLHSRSQRIYAGLNLMF